METTQEVRTLLEQLEKNSRRQVTYARIQCLFSVVAALCCLALLISVVSILPQANAIAQELQSLAEQTAGLASQAETVLSNLETVTADLASADLAGMVGSVDALVSDSQTGLSQALEKINCIDINALNTAIANLSAVVEPLANLVSRFR